MSSKKNASAEVAETNETVGADTAETEAEASETPVATEAAPIAEEPASIEEPVVEGTATADEIPESVVEESASSDEPIEPLRFGAEGDGVVDLQKSLVNWGVLGRDRATGVFDVNTLEALEHFQSGQTIARTGIVDELTQRALDGLPAKE